MRSLFLPIAIFYVGQGVYSSLFGRLSVGALVFAAVVIYTLVNARRYCFDAEYLADRFALRFSDKRPLVDAIKTLRH